MIHTDPRWIRAQRSRQHQQRMARVVEPDAQPWLAAVERDDRTDPHEGEQSAIPTHAARSA